MVCTALPCAALCSRRRPVSAIFAVFTHSGGQMSVIRTLCRDATWPNHCSWSRPFHPTRSQLRATAAAQVMRLPKKRHRQTDRQKARLRGVRLAGRRALRARAASALRASAAGPLVLGGFAAQKVPLAGSVGPSVPLRSRTGSGLRPELVACLGRQKVPVGRVCGASGPTDGMVAVGRGCGASGPTDGQGPMDNHGL